MLALAAIDDLLFEHGIDGGPVAWLHDEIVLEVPTEHAVKAAELLVKAMLDAFAETFPGAPLNGLVEANSGLNWAAAKEKNGMSKRFRNKFERSERDFYATPHCRQIKHEDARAQFQMGTSMPKIFRNMSTGVPKGSLFSFLFSYLDSWNL